MNLPNLPRYIRQRGNEWQGADHPDGPWRSIPAPQQALPWPTDGPAVPESREPASVAPEATGQPRPLSPAAQAVRRDLSQIMHEMSQRGRFSISATDTLPITLETNDASLQAGINNLCAAALRDAADQVVPDVKAYLSPGTASQIRSGILAIAAELRGEQADG